MKPEADEDFEKILGLLRSATGVDFSDYRDTTIKRRIARRMALHQQESLAGLRAASWRTNPPEVEALYRDILINVTSFFRDPEVFEALKTTVFPEIVKDKSPEIPDPHLGARLLHRAGSLLAGHRPAGVPGPEARCGRRSRSSAPTSTMRPSVEKARAGLYPHSIEAEVSPERLRRFFTKEDGGYRIGKSIRDMCVFARQNVTADPPFSRLDLISCRNLLIYLSAPLQQRIIPTFHYALNPGGFLLLGAVRDRRPVHRPVQRGGQASTTSTAKTATVARPYPYLRRRRLPGRGRRPPGRRRPSAPPTLADMQKEADRVILGRYAPAGGADRREPGDPPVPGTDRALSRAARRPAHPQPAARWPATTCSWSCAAPSTRPGDRTPPSAGRACGCATSTRRGWSTWRSSPSGRRVRPSGASWFSSRRPAAGGHGCRPAVAGAPPAPQPAPPDEGEVAQLRQELAVGQGIPPGHHRAAERRQRGTASRPTRRSSPATRNCRAPTRSCRPPRRSSSPPTRSCGRSTTSCRAATRKSARSTTT